MNILIYYLLLITAVALYVEMLCRSSTIDNAVAINVTSMFQPLLTRYWHAIATAAIVGLTIVPVKIILLPGNVPREHHVDAEDVSKNEGDLLDYKVAGADEIIRMFVSTADYVTAAQPTASSSETLGLRTRKSVTISNNFFKPRRVKRQTI